MTHEQIKLACIAHIIVNLVNFLILVMLTK